MIVDVDHGKEVKQPQCKKYKDVTVRLQIRYEEHKTNNTTQYLRSYGNTFSVKINEKSPMVSRFSG